METFSASLALPVGSSQAKKIDENLYIDYWPILAVFGDKKTENFVHMGHFHTYLEVPTVCLLNKVHGPIVKTSWENGKKSQLLPFFVIKDPIKLVTKNQNYNSTTFWG